MANNSWNALVADVNGKIGEMNTAISGANGAAGTVKTAAEAANAAADEASAAAQTAQIAARAAQEETQKWIDATAEATTAAAGSEASVSVGESGGVKKLSFVIPRGADGAKGEKGEPGRSGVTFSLSGSVLSITTG